MRLITRKSDLKPILNVACEKFTQAGLDLMLPYIDDEILSHKVKFPLLEWCASEFHQYIPQSTQLDFCDRIHQLNREGGNVILGKMLQIRSAKNLPESLDKAAEYISQADIWYVADIIGERVFGHTLLHQFHNTFTTIRAMSLSANHWLIRGFGAGSHYSIKKGLPKDDVETLFSWLLLQAHSSNKEIRQGIGWAAKTTAKFHPEIIKTFHQEIHKKHKIAQWFRTKIKIGLERHAHAQRNPG
ncbi:DNA alkylation repair protein [Marinicella sp. W31]|uniref:DNA alkylation repair protein n=1 Tax=Marinicella sp. W31 TaxID=3023713 RepID=UPI003757227E